MCVAVAQCKSRSIVLVGGSLIGLLRSASVCRVCRVTVSLVVVTESKPVNRVSREVSHRPLAFGGYDEVRSVGVLCSVGGNTKKAA